MTIAPGVHALLALHIWHSVVSNKRAPSGVGASHADTLDLSSERGLLHAAGAPHSRIFPANPPCANASSTHLQFGSAKLKSAGHFSDLCVSFVSGTSPGVKFTYVEEVPVLDCASAG